MELKGFINKFEYQFGEVLCFDNYVIGNLSGSNIVNTSIAETIINDINNYYGNRKIVYISNRMFAHNVDPQVYKLVNPDKMIGIAIVGHGATMRDQAIIEQGLYAGSFSFFESMESAVSWAQSFLDAKAVG
jgi:hypothetical protein